MFNFSSKKVASTPLSHFVNQATSSEKEQVYEKVIMAASESQNLTVEKAKIKAVA